MRPSFSSSNIIACTSSAIAKFVQMKHPSFLRFLSSGSESSTAKNLARRVKILVYSIISTNAYGGVFCFIVNYLMAPISASYFVFARPLSLLRMFIKYCILSTCKQIAISTIESDLPLLGPTRRIEAHILRVLLHLPFIFLL